MDFKSLLVFDAYANPFSTLECFRLLLDLTGLPINTTYECVTFPFFPFSCLPLRKVIFDETLQKCLDSYLCYAPRKFDALLDCHPEVNDMQKCLHRSVFLTFLRMSTHKESKVNISLPCRCSGLYNLGKRTIGEINRVSCVRVQLRSFPWLFLSVGFSVRR